MKTDSFAAFILTNGRPDRVFTYETLRRCGYTGKIFLIVDDLDKTVPAYKEKYGNEVVVFDKKAIAKKFDQGDNFQDMRAIVYARNASFEIAAKLGIKYFIQLDDDYTNFAFRFDNKFRYQPKQLTCLDEIFGSLLKFYKRTPTASLAVAQGGDFIGGVDGTNRTFKAVQLMRKCMNSFICSVDRPFKFVGRVNEDVNTYSHVASTGTLFFTLNQVSLGQMQTQSNKGGMTELYLDVGTYVKSFYSVIFQPSSVKIMCLQSSNVRIHHSVYWKNTVPKILAEKWKKK